MVMRINVTFNVSITLLLITVLSVSVPVFSEDKIHQHQESWVKGDLMSTGDEAEGFTSCICPDCAYVESSSSNAPLTLIEPLFIHSSIEERSGFNTQAYLVLKRPVPPTPRPPIVS